MNKYKTFLFNKNFISISSVLFLLIILSYTNALFTPFQFDDEMLVKYNPETKGDKYFDLTNIKYRHVFFLSFALNYYFGQDNVFGYHLTNILLHYFNAILIFLISFITVEKGALLSREAAFRISSFASLFFALNPAHTEAVTYISGRSSSLVTFFYLLAVLLFILGNIKPGVSGIPRIIFYILSMVAGVMAFGSKEISVTLPFAIILYDLCFMQNDNWVRFRHRLLYFYLPLPILAAIVIMKVFKMSVFFAGWLQKIDFDLALSHLGIISSAIQLYFIPVNLSFTYDIARIESFGEPTYILSILFLLAVIFLIIKKFYQESATLSFAAIWFFITISPTNSVFPRLDLFSDRNLYLPSFGLSLFFAYIFFNLLQRYQKKKSVWFFICLGCLTVALCANSLILIKRNAIYKTDLSLWESIYKKYPNNRRAIQNLSAYYLRNNNNKEAFVMLKRLTVLNPTNYYAHINLGMVFLDQGKFGLAVKEYQNAKTIDSNLPEAYVNLGTYYALKGNFIKAKKEYEMADLRYGWNKRSIKFPELFREKIWAKLILNKARLNIELGQAGEAEKELQRYSQIYHEGDSQKVAKAHNRVGYIYVSQNKMEKAISQFEKAIFYDPEMVEAHFNLGKLMLEFYNDERIARNHFEKALELRPEPNKAKIIKDILHELNS